MQAGPAGTNTEPVRRPAPANWAFDLHNSMPRPRRSHLIEYGVDRVLDDNHHMTPCGYNAWYRPPESSFDGLDRKTPLEDGNILNTFSSVVYGMSSRPSSRISRLVRQRASELAAASEPPRNARSSCNNRRETHGR